MGMFFGKRDSDTCGYGGWWRTESKSDPGFDMGGYANGVWDAASKADEAIKSRIRQLGLTEDQVPNDIEYSGGKD